MKILYYLIQWTWGIVMNLIGLITFIVCKILKYPTYKYRNAICIVVPGKNFGGLELGMFFIRGERNEEVCPHEYGHGIQNLWWGPLFPFVIAIPSATRYWLRNQKTQDSKRLFVEIITVIVLFAYVVVGLINILWIEIIAASILAYWLILEIWLFFIEIPKYDNNAKVPYDSIWFEGQATSLGNRANAEEWSWL